MKKLLFYLKPYIKETVFAPVFKLLEASFELIVPIVVAIIIDTGIGLSDKGIIINYSLILVLLGIIGLVVAITAQYFAAKAAIGFATELRGMIFRRIQSFSYSKLDTVGKSRLINTLTNDINQVQTGVNLTLRLLLRSPFIVLGSMVMAFIIDPSISVIFAVMIPLLFISVFVVMKITLPGYKKTQSNLDSVILSVRENLNGVRVIRAFGREDKEEESFKNKNLELKKLQNKTATVSAFLNPLTFVIVNFAVIALIWFGALKVNAGILTQGQTIALYGYLSQILVELMKFANLIVTVTKSVAAGNRVQEIAEIPEEDITGVCFPDNTDISVEFKDVSLCYDGASDKSLEDISFSVPKGYTVGVIGGTGSGKTSLVNLIPGFYKPTSGHIYINGVDIKNISVKNLREKIGVVPQKSVLFKGTIRENLLWGNTSACDDDILSALKTAQATDIIASRCEGLDFEVSQNGNNFSGGQKQRLCIARALIKNPDILILDDSSSSLDYLTDKNLRNALSERYKDMTVFIVSQRTAAFTDADMIIVIDDGKISAIGTHSELLENCAVYREIYDSQFSEEV